MARATPRTGAVPMALTECLCSRWQVPGVHGAQMLSIRIWRCPISDLLTYLFKNTTTDTYCQVRS